MIEEEADRDGRGYIPHQNSFLTEHEVFLDVMRKTFAEMDEKALEGCPPGCLLVFWLGERKEQ